MGSFSLHVLCIVSVIVLQPTSEEVSGVKFEKPTNDFVFKKVFCSDPRKNSTENELAKEAVVKLVNDVLKLKGDMKIKTLEICPSEALPEKQEGKRIIYDYCGVDNMGQEVIIEMQRKNLAHFGMRAQFIISRSLNSKITDTKTDFGTYKTLKSSSLLVICGQTLFKQKDRWNHTISDYYMREMTFGDVLNDVTRITFFELPKCRNITSVDDLLTSPTREVDLWCLFFNQPPVLFKTKLMEEIKAKNGVMQRAFERVNRLNWTPEEVKAFEESRLNEEDLVNTVDAAVSECRGDIILRIKKTNPGMSTSEIAHLTGLPAEVVKMHLEN